MNAAKEIHHWAIFCTNEANTESLIQHIIEGKLEEHFHNFNGLKGVVYSAAAIQEFIEEESKRDYTILNRADKRNIRSFSSGEQKKALLAYLLSQQPDYLILDNVFDNLDADNQKLLQEKIIEIANHIAIIQIIQRKTDWLPFIKKGLHFHQELIPINNIELFVAQKVYSTKHPSIIPPPIHSYQLTTENLVTFKNVTVHYDETKILNNINWVINVNEFWQLKGANGSGKTTLLTMITGDNVKGFGKDLYLFGSKKGNGESVWEIKDKIGYVTPAMTDLFKTRSTVAEMIVSGFYDSIGLYVIPSEIAKQLTQEWLSVLNLESIQHKIFCELPLGLQRKILIARAMVKHPPLLILDEPAYGLDDENTGMIIEFINLFAKETNTSIVYVSHREEQNLTPQFIFELIKTDDGSVGEIISHR